MARFLERFPVLMRRHAFYLAQDCTINVDKRTMYGMYLSILQVSQSIRERIISAREDVPGNLSIVTLYHPRRAAEYDRGDLKWSFGNFFHDQNFDDTILPALAEQSLGRGYAKIELRIVDHPIEHARVDLRHLQRLLLSPYNEFMESTEIVLVCENTTAGGSITISRSPISLISLQRYWFIYLTHLMDDNPQHMNLPMSPTFVDNHWNIMASDNAYHRRPPSEEDWDMFVQDPSSVYSKVLSRFCEMGKYECSRLSTAIYWFALKHVLIDQDMGDSIPDELDEDVWENVRVLFADFI